MTGVASSPKVAHMSDTDTVVEAARRVGLVLTPERAAAAWPLIRALEAMKVSMGNK